MRAYTKIYAVIVARSNRRNTGNGNGFSRCLFPTGRQPMTKRVRIIKRNQRSYIIYRRLHNYRQKFNPFTGFKVGLADFIYKGKKRTCKIVNAQWTAHI